MKVLFSSNKNPHFITFTEYIEKALKENNCNTLFFENRQFSIPGRFRHRIPFLHSFDLQRINKKLLSIIETYQPDLFLEAGGWNILPKTIEVLKKRGIKTILWTIDPPRIFESIKKIAPYYDYVFTQGSEAYEILEGTVKNLYWMPFACDPDFHKPQALTDKDRRRYAYDIAFVGSLDPELYPFRIEILRSLIDFNLGIWGPGSDKIPSSSPIKSFINGKNLSPDIWTKIYSASKIILCTHWKDPLGKLPCYQASPRVYETLACGGFLVCDKQRDVLRLFKEGEQLTFFDNIADLREIILYYLQNPDEVKNIAEKGRKEVLDKHTYKHRIKEILSTIGTPRP